MMAFMTASLIAPIASLLMQPVTSSLINVITGKWVMIGGKEKEGRFFTLIAAPLILKTLAGKGVTRAGKEYNNMDHMEKNF